MSAGKVRAAKINSYRAAGPSNPCEEKPGYGKLSFLGSGQDLLSWSLGFLKMFRQYWGLNSASHLLGALYCLSHTSGPFALVILEIGLFSLGLAWTMTLLFYALTVTGITGTRQLFLLRWESL
jgi:hypothetical protein